MRTKLRVAAAILAMSASGCSWVFQDRLRGGLASYDGNAEPNCTPSKGWAVLDGLFAGLGGATILLGATADELSSGDKTILIVGGIFDLLVHGSSAITGSNWANECRRAYADYQNESRGAPPADAELDRLRAQIERNGDSVAPHEQVPETPRPRGFYCASSATASAAGLCTREKADCARARDAAIGLIADITECGLVESALCFDVKPGELRCSPTAESCAAQRERAGVASECREEK